MSHVEHLKQLHDLELYQDLKQFACIVLTLWDNSPDADVPTLGQKYQCMVYYGNALYHLAEYTKAEDIYKRALSLRKALNKTKEKPPPGISQNELTSDVEVKYKIYQCLTHLKQYREAMSVLEGISTKQRTAKINMALAKLYLRSGMDRSAITSYKEVLRECPMALDAVFGLLSLGLKGADVVALVMTGMPQGMFCDWLSSWIRGHALLTSQEYTKAIQTFRCIDSKTALKDNIYLMTSIAKAAFLEGHYTQAMLTFQRAHAMDPLHIQHMDIYAYLLAKEKKTVELQRLANQLMKATEAAAEPWLAMGYYSLETKKASRALYFAHKANSIDPTNVESLLLKGLTLLEVKKAQEAILHYQSAVRLAPQRFEAYKGLIDCYLAAHRTREALAWAGKALKTLGASVRTLTLYGSVVAKEPATVSKAKPYLEKAMKLDASNLEPVYVLTEILGQEKQFDKGIEMLRSYLQNQSTCRLHQMLGDFLTQIGDHLEALDQYSKALGLDPSNARAKEGIERVEKQGDMGAENTFDVEVEEMENSENEAEFDASDVESTWSETDFS